MNIDNRDNFKEATKVLRVPESKYEFVLKTGTQSKRKLCGQISFIISVFEELKTTHPDVYNSICRKIENI